MHIRNEARPVKPTKPNTNRVRVTAPQATAKPQERHATRVISARRAAVSDPKVAAAIARERAETLVDAAKHALAFANLDLTEAKDEDAHADVLATLATRADAAQTKYIAAKAALAELVGAAS